MDQNFCKMWKKNYQKVKFKNMKNRYKNVSPNFALFDSVHLKFLCQTATKVSKYLPPMSALRILQTSSRTGICQRTTLPSQLQPLCSPSRSQTSPECSGPELWRFPLLEPFFLLPTQLNPSPLQVFAQLPSSYGLLTCSTYCWKCSYTSPISLCP